MPLTCPLAAPLPLVADPFSPASMSLSTFLQRLGRSAGARPGAEPAVATPADVDAARTRARRRLIGMAVLVGAGMVIFPTFLETQPRPVSVDVQVSRAGASSPATGGVVTPASRVAVAPVQPPVYAPSPAVAERDDTERDDTDRVTPPVTPPVTPVKPAPPPASPKPATPPAPRPVEARPADTRDARPAADTRTAERYVVQFGAFADPKAARDARLKLERLGVQTYAQQVDTPDGKRTRVRMGPFANRAEADKALAALRKAGLDGKVLTL